MLATLLLTASAASLHGHGYGPRTPADSTTPLVRLESAWPRFRTLDDQLRITGDLGASVSPRGVPIDTLRARARLALEEVRSLAAMAGAGHLLPADRRAVATIEANLGALGTALAEPGRPGASPGEPCRSAGRPVLDVPLDSLAARTFLCYGQAARRIVVDGDTLDRLSILRLLGRNDDSARRRRLFLALEPVWRSVNGDDGAESPYREMVRKRVAGWQGSPDPMAQRARGLGVAPDTLERWLVQVLEGWRASQPDSLVEPWDFYYRNGEAGRRLSARIPRDSLRPLVERYYRSLGADLARLGVHWDLEPRAGKYPISFTDFGARDPVEPWIFTSYRIGGLDNLEELVHEAGHAVHIAAIRTRPAFTDWPDSDTFTEAIADLAALELYEPRWQRRFLGASAPAAAAFRAKFSGIMMDVAWALFEIRVHRDPDLSPNAIWAGITGTYFRIRPHPEWSWWAMRGQLVDAPFYMMNYAFGAILITDIRARLRARHGSFTAGDPSWYRWVSARLYRFGLERSAEAVVTSFLGRGVAVEPLLRELRAGQVRTPAPPRPGTAGSAPGE